MSYDDRNIELDCKIDFDRNNHKPIPPPRSGSLRTDYSESEDGISVSCKDIEGESVDALDLPDNLDMPVFSPFILKNCDKSSSKAIYRSASGTIPFPKIPCFSEFDDNDKLQFHGPITQIVQKLTSSKKSRYAVLMSNKLVLFEKPEHKVSKVQIPLKSMKGIDWVDSINCSNKNDCNKFKLETPVKSFKFQGSSHENAGIWINHIGKIIYNKQQIDESNDSFILKASVSLENVKGKRIFTIETKYTIAYYDSEEDFKYGIAMHRIQLRSSGVKREGTDGNSLSLITSYRKYKLTFENSAQCNEWFQEITLKIQKAISSTCSRNAKTGDDIMNEIGKNYSNRICVECKSSEIEWASVNLFVTLCSKCSGLHRRLGPNISKIQGIFTDESTWEDNNLIKLFQVIGNNNANNFWLGNFEGNQSEIDYKFINDKYSKKKFLMKKETIFEKFRNIEELNKELLECVKTDNILRTMQLFHIGADINYMSKLNDMNAKEIANKHHQYLQLTYLNCQCKSQIRDWRSDLFDSIDVSIDEEIPHQGKMFCSINQKPKEFQKILIWKNCIQILENCPTKNEICKILFRNICLLREKNIEPDGITLIIVVQDTEYSTKCSDFESSINVIEFFGAENDQSNNLRDFKNAIGQNLSPNFTPSFSYACIGWVIMSTVSEDWKPYLLAINYNSVANFYKVKETNENLFLTIDLRKVNKIEELKDNNYENVCPYKMYNLASICLMSSVIYHLRGDTKESHEELHKAFLQSWLVRDFNSISNQFLTQNGVPLPVSKMIRYLQIHGTQIEGLFRKVGSIREAEKIYNQLITDPNSYILTSSDPYDVASALKLFFRKLDDPLLTKLYYENWLAAVDIKDSENKLKYFKNIIEKLPVINYQTLRLLIFLLVNIDKNNAITQMNPDNLSTSFNTCLIAGSDQGFNMKNLQILPYLIRNYKDLFDVTQEELEMEKLYNKERRKIKDCPPTDISLLRQIYILPELENFLKPDINYERELTTKKTDYFKELLSKQLRIEQSMTSNSLLKKLFNENISTPNILIFEDRKVDDFHMEHLIYPDENLIEVIQNSEKTDSMPKKWIFKNNRYEMGFESNNKSFLCSASLSMSNRNKIYIEISDTHQMNIWKSEQTSDLLLSIPIKDLILFRSCEKDKNFVAFEDRKNQINTLPSSVFLFFRSRSSFNIINFSCESDYLNFLKYYDRSKLTEIKFLESRNTLQPQL